jgi:hypothetical protein
VIPLDGRATFLTKYPANGKDSLAFVDSGSNGIYFLDKATTGIRACSGPYAAFYCPASTLNLSAKSQDVNGLVTATMNFSIANAETLFASLQNVAFANLGGQSAAPSTGGPTMTSYFDWGLPFYFGKNVFASIEGQTTPVGKELFVAF